MRLWLSSNFILFTILVFLILLLEEMTIYFLDLNQLLYKSLSEQLTIKQIEKFFSNRSRWSWVKYIVQPVGLFVKTTIISWILAMGGFFFGIELSHKKYWNIVLKAEFVFLMMMVAKILWFLFIQPEFSLEEVQQLTPFSLQSFINTSNLPDWIIYPLQLVNFFEVVYWIILCSFINKVSNTKKGSLIVFSSYGSILFIWIIFIMFLTLNLS